MIEHTQIGDNLDKSRPILNPYKWCPQNDMFC